MTPLRFGQVWDATGSVIGPLRYLIVSSDDYNEIFGDRRGIAVEIDANAVYEGPFREPIPDAGTAHLDRITWVARRRLVDIVSELHPDRHADVSRTILNLIGSL